MPTQNLVQIQRDLQSLPPGPQTMMYLKRAKDGMVATVPPYVAAAELAAREKMAQREALASGAAPGEQPTVSQQLSQKADLLALQAMKKKEMDAQAMNQARTAPGPAPEGSPAPEEQPQRERGLPQIPVDFGLAGGGIVAFNGETGSEVKKPSIYDLERDPLLRRFREWLASRGEEAPAPQPEPGSIAAAFPEGSGIRKVAGFLTQRDKDIAAWQAAQKAQQQNLAPQEEPQAPPPSPVSQFSPGRTSPMTPQQREAQVRQPPAPLQQRPPAAPGAQAAAPQQPAQPSPQDLLQANLMQQLGLAPGAPGAPGAPAAAAGPTIAKSAEDVKAAQAAFGLDKAAGEEERRLIDEMRARHAQQQKERARMGLKAVLGGFSQGYGGAAAADVGASQRAYTEDMAHQKAMYDMINAINKGNRGEAEKAFERTMGLQEKREGEAGATSRAELQAKVAMYGNLLQADSSRYNTDAHVRVALLNAKQTDARATREDKKIALDGLQSAERGIQTELTKLQGAFDKSSKDRRAQLDADLKEIRAQIAKIAGVEPPTRGAAPAAQGKVVNWSDIK